MRTKGDLPAYRRTWRDRLRRLAFMLTHEWPWWLRHRLDPRHRYHVIRTGLKPGWVDRDRLMAVLVVKCLVDFVEKERPFEVFDTESGPNADQWAELRALYEFFRGRDLDAMQYDELTAKLVEVVKLRKRMWT